MPVVRESVSISVFCDELGIDPKRFIGVEVNRKASTVVLVLEPEDEATDVVQRLRTATTADANSRT